MNNSQNDLAEEILKKMLVTTGGKVREIIRGFLVGYHERDRDDVFQEVWIRFHRALQGCNGPDAMEKMATQEYLCTIARNAARDHLRRNKRPDRRGISSAVGDDGSEVDILALLEDDKAQDAFLEVDSSQFVAAADALIEILPKETQQAWKYFVDNLPLAEIARRLGTTVYKVNKLVEQAKTTLLPLARQYLKGTR